MKNNKNKTTFTEWLQGWLRPSRLVTSQGNQGETGTNPPGQRALQPSLALSQVHSRVDDDPAGWAGLQGSPHDYDHAQVQELYADALTAWRKNPIAFRIISITTDYVVGDSIQVSSSLPGLDQFIQAFWNHPQNRMALRLEAMCDELARSGDLFVVLFRSE